MNPLEEDHWGGSTSGSGRAELYGNGRKAADWKRVYVGPIEPSDAGTANLAEEWERALG